MTNTRPADFLDAINTAASAQRMESCHDSGPTRTGRLVVYGDETYCHDYLHGRGRLGRKIEIHFSTRGAIEAVSEAVDNRTTVRLPAGGDISTRLQWTLDLFKAAHPGQQPPT